jgi:putative FmdB family regulatory protein
VPIYRYECSGCGEGYEKLVTPSRPEPKICPVCKKKLVRVPSVSNFSLKGAGFHKNDYKKG